MTDSIKQQLECDFHSANHQEVMFVVTGLLTCIRHLKRVGSVNSTYVCTYTCLMYANVYNYEHICIIMYVYVCTWVWFFW